MWPALHLEGAMGFLPDTNGIVTNGRPWTPPDTDSEYSVSNTMDAEEGAKGHPGTSNNRNNSERAPSPLQLPLPPRRSSQARPPDRRPKPTTSATEPRLSTMHFDMEHSQRMAPISTSKPDRESTRRSTYASLADSGYVGEAEGEGEGEAHDIVPQYVHVDEPPHTPVKQTRTPDPLPLNIPRYPYTPDSARMPTRKFDDPPLSPSPSKTVPPLYPSPSMPWDNNAPSPVQNALTSCMTHLENLIQTRQPNEEQMEYIVARFEEMAQFLSAPEAQSRQSDDHLFSELSEIPSGLGIISGVLTDNSDRIARSQVDTALHYINEVGRYIADVSRHTEHLKMRFDETKQLNHIQTEIIADLRRILKIQQVEMEKMTEELDIELSAVGDQQESVGDSDDGRSKQQLDENDGEHQRGENEDEELAQVVKQPEPTQHVQPVSFWTAIGEALDAVGELLLEY